MKLRSLTHTPEISAINSMPDSGASFCANTQLLTLFVPQRQSTTLEVVHRHKKLAPEAGVEFRHMAPVYGVCVSSLCLLQLAVPTETDTNNQWRHEQHPAQYFRNSPALQMGI